MPSNQIRGISIPDPTAQHTARAAAARQAIRQKLDDLPPAAADWAGALVIDCDEEQFVLLMQAFAHILTASRADGRTYVPVSRSDLSDAIGVSPDAAGKLLGQLEQHGMVERKTRMIGLPDTYRALRFGDRDQSGHVRTVRSEAGRGDPMRPAPITDGRLLAGLFGVRAA